MNTHIPPPNSDRASGYSVFSNLTARELAEVLNLPSENTIKALAREKKIPVTKIGYRTHRYDLEKVRAALAKLEVKAV